MSEFYTIEFQGGATYTIRIADVSLISMTNRVVHVWLRGLPSALSMEFSSDAHAVTVFRGLRTELTGVDRLPKGTP